MMYIKLTILRTHTGLLHVLWRYEHMCMMRVGPYLFFATRLGSMLSKPWTDLTEDTSQFTVIDCLKGDERFDSWPRLLNWSKMTFIECQSIMHLSFCSHLHINEIKASNMSNIFAALLCHNVFWVLKVEIENPVAIGHMLEATQIKNRKNPIYNCFPLEQRWT